MASPSEVKGGLDVIAAAIAKNRAALASCISAAANVSADLAALPGQFTDLINTVTAYGTDDAFEAVTKAALVKLTDEFIALKANADAIAAVNLGS